MHISINTATQFMNAFIDMGRGDQFSFEALARLFNYYDELDDHELDVIAICCDWTEYETEAEACEELRMEDMDELKDTYQVIELLNGGVLVSN